jgi:hypothetical protein
VEGDGWWGGRTHGKGMGSFLIGGVVFYRSTKGRKGEEHICLVFKRICTYNLAFKHVHGSLIRLFVSFDKNTPIVPNRIYICLWGVRCGVCVCVPNRGTNSQRRRVQNHVHTCLKSHRTPFPNNWCPNQHTSLCAHTHNQRLLPAVLC